ncbi:MAG: hypothetical protein LKI24_17205 [Acidipropionibacterium sp.]|nr:hypothetical protein [Acidipropionibacterium sp.]
MGTMRARTRWADLPRAAQIGLAAAGSVEALLRIWSLVDLARRPAAQIRGSKAAWALSLTTVNSVGLLPLIYLTRGRRG